jgi:predicted enzyme related to lactoylglutathione lyase
MSTPFQQHGAFSWCELMTSDLEAAKQFYGSLFGWTLEDSPMEDMTYTVIKVEGKEVGGMMSTSAPQVQGNPSPHWGTYVTVQNVDATAQQAKELGAQLILEPMDIPDVGRFAVLQDPQGAVLSIITYNAMV